MPWRNGGGTTQEVACNAGGSSAAFTWRLSIADVAQAGGFSAFSGLQRVITVLEGAGIALTVDGREEAPLRARQAYAFSGDARVDCRLLDGPIRDFNLIYSPRHYHARLQWIGGVRDWTFHSAARTVLLFNAGDARSRRGAMASCCRRPRATTACIWTARQAWPNTAWNPRRSWTPA
ncbi:HutD family protein [Achromobacter insuavis]